MPLKNAGPGRRLGIAYANLFNSIINKMNKVAAQDENFEEIIDEEYKVLISRGQKAFYGITIVSICALGTYLWHFAGLGWSSKQEVWGQFGDFLGGLLNPAVGLVTIYLVLANVRMQQKELRNSLQELKTSNVALIKQIKASELQSFEQTFFTWLNSYQNIVNSASYTNPQGILSSGRDSLLNAYSYQFNDNDIARAVVAAGLPAGECFIKFHESGYVSEEHMAKVQAAIMAKWTSVYNNMRHHIGSMFRTLFRLLVWIDSQPSSILDTQKKWEYIKIVRAQISDIELIYLYLNGHTEQGKKFARIINKYAIFDNLDIHTDYILAFLAHLPETPFTPEAYYSDIARVYNNIHAY